MSPEQCRGERVDGRSDLFSSAIILFELLTGKQAFKEETQIATMQSIILKELPTASKFNPKVPAAVDAVLEKALAKNPDDRYQTAQEFKDALLSASQHVSVVPTIQRKPTQILGAVAATLLLTLGALYYWQIGSSGSLDKPDPDAGANVDYATSTNDLSAEDIEKVNRLLRVASAHTFVGRLVSPPGGNAYDAYRLVLEIDPNNSMAIKGTNKIPEELIAYANQLLNNGDREAAIEHIELGLNVYPQHSKLIAYLAEINQP